MLFTESEFVSLIKPLLNEESENRERIGSLLGFSHLCEPSDSLPGLLSLHLPIELLFQEVIARAESRRISEKIGQVGVQEIEEALRTDFSSLWANALERWQARLSKKSVLDSLHWMNDQSAAGGLRARLVLQGASDYPLEFEDLRTHQPFVLWTLGNEALLTQDHRIAIVGTRQASRYGAEVARELAAVAATNGIATVSGGAFGIDAIIHESALALDSSTIAFMAGGLAHLYPRNNLAMLQQVGRSGLLVAECAPTVTPAKWRFLMRNRLIAAGSNATVVVEAGKTSGALNTAGTAVSLGRVVAVVPGQLNSARSVGCHDFLNSNPGDVQLLARPNQLLDLVGLRREMSVEASRIGILERRALDAFGNGPIETWEVQRLAGLTVRESQIALGSLELLGLVERRGTRYLRVLDD